MQALSVTNLSVQYPHDSKRAVDAVSFALEKGSIAVLIGPNGSGKSSVLKALLGLLDSTGEVLFFGKPLEKVRGKVGYVPQRYSVDTTIPVTVYEFLMLGLLTCQHSDREKREMITTVLEKVNVLGKEKEKIADLSGGQLQRLLLARAIIHSPKFLILDEPEAGVDAGGEQLFYTLLKKLSKEDGVTFLLASHEVALIHEFADAVICINKELVCYGKPKKVLTADTFKKLYGSGVMYYSHQGHEHHHHADTHQKGEQ